MARTAKSAIMTWIVSYSLNSTIKRAKTSLLTQKYRVNRSATGRFGSTFWYKVPYFSYIAGVSSRAKFLRR